jgi:hypothetical protein
MKHITYDGNREYDNRRRAVECAEDEAQQQRQDVEDAIISLFGDELSVMAERIEAITKQVQLKFPRESSLDIKDQIHEILKY